MRNLIVKTLSTFFLSVTGLLVSANDIFDERHFYFPGGHSKALILSYDDGLIQDLRLIKLLNRYGIKGTFHINSGLLGQDAPWLAKFTKNPGKYVTRKELKTLYTGHEIAAHSSTHPHLIEQSDKETLRQINEDVKSLEDITGTTVDNLAYPFGEFNNHLVNLLKSTPIKSARTVKDTHDFKIPNDYLRWDPTSHHTKAQKTLHRFLNGFTDSPQVFLLWGHSWEFDMNKPNNNWGLIEEMLIATSKHKDIWFAGAGEFVRYLEAVKSVQLKQGEWVNQSNIPVTLKKGKTPIVIPPNSSLKK